MVGGRRGHAVTQSLSSHLLYIQMQWLLHAHVQISPRIVRVQKCLWGITLTNSTHASWERGEMVLLLSTMTDAVLKLHYALVYFKQTSWCLTADILIPDILPAQAFVMLQNVMKVFVRKINKKESWSKILRTLRIPHQLLCAACILLWFACEAQKIVLPHSTTKNSDPSLRPMKIYTSK